MFHLIALVDCDCLYNVAVAFLFLELEFAFCKSNIDPYAACHGPILLASVLFGGRMLFRLALALSIRLLIRVRNDNPLVVVD